MPASCLRRLVYTKETDGHRKMQIRMASPSEMVLSDDEMRRLDVGGDDDHHDHDSGGRVTLPNDAMRRRNSRVVVTGIGREMLVKTLYSLLSTADVHVDGVYRYENALPATTATGGKENMTTTGVIVEYVHPWQATQALMWFDNLDVGRGNVMSIRRWMEEDGVVSLENRLPREGGGYAVAAESMMPPGHQMGDASRATTDMGIKRTQGAHTHHEQQRSTWIKQRQDRIPPSVDDTPVYAGEGNDSFYRSSTTINNNVPHTQTGVVRVDVDENTIAHAQHNHYRGDTRSMGASRAMISPNCIPLGSKSWNANRRGKTFGDGWYPETRPYAHLRTKSEVVFRVLQRNEAMSNKLFVGNLPKTRHGNRELTLEDLCEYFGNKYGEIADAVIVCDKTTSALRGFAYVTFVNKDSLDRVLADGNKHYIQNSKEAVIEADCNKAKKNTFSKKSHKSQELLKRRRIQERDTPTQTSNAPDGQDAHAFIESDCHPSDHDSEYDGRAKVRRTSSSSCEM